MRIRVLLLAAVASMVMFAGAGKVYAQVNDEKKMSMGEMAKEANKMLSEMRTLKDQAEARLRKARSDKDIERMDAINEALIALKGVLNLAEGYFYDLDDRIKNGDAKGAAAEFRKIKISYSKMQELDSQIRSAGGPSDQGVVEGKPVVEWSKDADLPTEDPAEDLQFNEVYLDRPESASPFH